MDDMPPRRSRRPQKSRSDASTFPLIPFLIGVVVLGFVIGAGLSMAGRHGGSAGDVAAIPSPAVATESPTFAPATLAPLATPRPMASSSPTHENATQSPVAQAPSPRATSSREASPKPSLSAALARATQAASPHAASAVALATHSPSTLLVTPVTPVPLHSRAAATAPPAPTSVASSEGSATSVPATTIDADSDFGRLSANVVRQYLRALGRGDTDSAGGALAAGSGSATFPEQAAMQAPGQIENIQARGNNETQYVTVDIDTPSGKYYATFGVHRTATGAAVIATHSISKQ
jgi:hypothetical protein